MPEVVNDDLELVNAEATYKPFDCGDDCHLIRYSVFTARTLFGARRWGVLDNHLGQRLTPRYRDRLALHNWLVLLRTMEIRERWAVENRKERLR